MAVFVLRNDVRPLGDTSRLRPARLPASLAPNTGSGSRVGCVGFKGFS